MFERYADKLRGILVERAGKPVDDCARRNHLETTHSHLLWMCELCVENIAEWPLDKLNRWLGYVQGVLAVSGDISVDAERDFSRPIFHSAYAEEKRKIPPTSKR